MGMHDYVRVEGHELPGLDPELVARKQEEVKGSVAWKPAVFKANAFGSFFGVYVIKGGRLHERVYRIEEVPEEERPWYGTPEWDRGDAGWPDARERFGGLPWLFGGPEYYQEIGAERVAGHEDRDLGYHGDLVFYAAKNDLGLTEDHGENSFVEFRARFTYGGLDWIRPVGTFR